MKLIKKYTSIPLSFFLIRFEGTPDGDSWSCFSEFLGPLLVSPVSVLILSSDDQVIIASYIKPFVLWMIVLKCIRCGSFYYFINVAHKLQIIQMRTLISQWVYKFRIRNVPTITKQLILQPKFLSKILKKSINGLFVVWWKTHTILSHT
jgi:hypothetical protein